ncbi:MAG: CRTAC1 family protein [Nitrospirota bacterium]
MTVRRLARLIIPLLAAAACVRPEVRMNDFVGFVDVTQASGVRAEHVNGAVGNAWYPETFGAGVCAANLDADDLPDLLFVTGRSWDDASSGPGVAAYRNRGDGTFQDVTAGSGLAMSRYGMGCATADYDNDGREDVVFTGYGGTALFHNEGDGRFRDVTIEAGVGDTGWSTCAVWFDADKDGRLDLFLCHYVVWTPETDRVCRLDTRVKVFCGPDPYPPAAPRLLRNVDGARFEDVTERVGLSKPGKALGAAMFDEDGDGRIDLFVANDQMPNFLYRNRGDGTFEDLSESLAPWPGRFGMARAGMGVDVDDAAGRVPVGNFIGEGITLYERDADGRFRDRARETGVSAPSLPFLTFGLALADVDLDGRLDLIAANGHVDAELARVLDGGARQHERPLLFRGTADGAYTEVGTMVGLAAAFVGRGLAAADFDRDGDIDLVFTENNGPARLYRNDLAKHRWLGVTLQGAGSNRDGIGAMVSVTAGGRTQTRMVRTGSSYLSQSERALLFGLGTADRVDEITVRWPSGTTEQRPGVIADQRLVITEGRVP